MAVVEIEPQKNHISYCNKEGNKVLQSIFRKLKPLTRIPDMLRKNDFLFSQLGMDPSEEDLALQSELLSKPMYRLHEDETELEILGDKSTEVRAHTHSLKDLAQLSAFEDKIFSHEMT